MSNKGWNTQKKNKKKTCAEYYPAFNGMYVALNFLEENYILMYSSRRKYGQLLVAIWVDEWQQIKSQFILKKYFLTLYKQADTWLQLSMIEHKVLLLAILVSYGVLPSTVQP